MGFFSTIFGGKTDAAAAGATSPATAAAAPAGEKGVVLCPVEGELVALESVADPVFAEKTMGDGVAVKPATGELVSPVSGVVEALFPTGHALAIKGDNGVSVMLHIGIDTVDMKGEGFSAHISQGDRVEVGQALVSFDLEKIAAAGYDSTVMVVVPEASCGGQLCKHEPGQVKIGDKLIWHVA